MGIREKIKLQDRQQHKVELIKQKIEALQQELKKANQTKIVIAEEIFEEFGFTSLPLQVGSLLYLKELIEQQEDSSQLNREIYAKGEAYLERLRNG